MQESQPAERTRTMSYTDEFLKFAGASVGLVHFSHVPKTRASQALVGVMAIDINILS